MCWVLTGCKLFAALYRKHGGEPWSSVWHFFSYRQCVSSHPSRWFPALGLCLLGHLPHFSQTQVSVSVLTALAEPCCSQNRNQTLESLPDCCPWSLLWPLGGSYSLQSLQSFQTSEQIWFLPTELCVFPSLLHVSPWLCLSHVNLSIMVCWLPLLYIDLSSEGLAYLIAKSPWIHKCF